MDKAPVTPSAAKRLCAQGTGIPDCVIRAANALIVKNLSGSRSTFRLEELVELSCKYYGGDPDAARSRLIEDKSFDIEEMYRDQGWYVEFDKPGFCETHPATFTFTIRDKTL